MKVLEKLFGILFTLLFIITPYISMVAAEAALLQRGYKAIGGEDLIPIACFIGLSILAHLEQYCRRKANAK